MHPRIRRSVTMIVLVAALLVLLPLLAVLQYRWLGQVSESELERLRASLQTSAAQFSQDFDGELTRIYSRFQLDEATVRNRDSETVALRYDNWQSVTEFPRLVGGIFVADLDEQQQLLLWRFNFQTRSLENCEWPDQFSILRDRIEQQRILADRVGPLLRGLFEQRKNNSTTNAPAYQLPVEPLAEEIPALVIPVMALPIFADKRPSGDSRFGYTIVEIDQTSLKEDFISGLRRQHFAAETSPGYDLAIVSLRDPGKTIYESRSGMLKQSDDLGDATANLFGLRWTDIQALGMQSPIERSGINGDAIMRSGYSVNLFSRIRPRGGGRLNSEDSKQWRLIVKHPAGSLAAVIASARLRSLVIAFGTLLLLAVSVALIIITTQRAQRLARQQMEFVAGVSHELRTPLAVICSAGENLSDGVIDQPQQVRRYGTVIMNEGRRLTEMVEQALEFAGIQSNRKAYVLRPVEIAGVIASALTECERLLSEGGFIVDVQIEPRLPIVMADRSALQYSIQNLLNNAVKYSSEHRVIGLSAKTAKQGSEVRITVEDGGLGISSGDLPHIFEPFYRGREVIGTQIRGNGLGLSLVKRIIEAHQGRVTVESRPGLGSSFTLHLPIKRNAVVNGDLDQQRRPT